MITINLNEEIIDRGEEHDFYYEGTWYVGYSRQYGDGSFDVEVYLRDNPDEQVESHVYDYAHDMFEYFGFI